MNPITSLAFLALLTACGQADVSEYQVISSSALQILEPGAEPPADCAGMGTVAIPQRNPSFIERHSGLADEEFFRLLHAQIDPLDANLLAPNDGSNVVTAASSGQPFEGVAYSCP